MLPPRDPFWNAVVDAVNGDPDSAKQQALTRYLSTRDLTPVSLDPSAPNDEYDGTELSAYLSSVADEFEPPIQLPHDRTTEASPFPLEVLPPVARALVETVAASTQTPVDLAANMLLGSCSATVAGKARVNAESHREHLNLWTAVILAPGERKSSALATILAPLYRLQQERKEKAAEGLADRTATFELAKAEFDRLKKKKETASEDLAAALRKRDLAAAELVAPALLVVDDVTPEKLAADLQANPRLLLAAAEGGAIDNFLGRYQRGVPNLDLLNKAWAGESHTVRRVSLGDEGLFLESPTLAIAIAPQPIVMRQAARNPVLTARGTLSRFLIAAPASLVGTRRSTSPALDHDALAAYDVLVRELVEAEEAPDDLRILPPALTLIRAYRDRLERSAGGAVDERLRAFLARMSGYVYRLAGVLHFLKHGASGFGKPIGRRAARGAVELAEYYEIHAETALDLMGGRRHAPCEGHVPVAGKAPRHQRHLSGHDCSRRPPRTHELERRGACRGDGCPRRARALPSRTTPDWRDRTAADIPRPQPAAREGRRQKRHNAACGCPAPAQHGRRLRRPPMRSARGHLPRRRPLLRPARDRVPHRVQPLVDDIETTRPCQQCGQRFTTSADSAESFCSHCMSDQRGRAT